MSELYHARMKGWYAATGCKPQDPYFAYNSNPAIIEAYQKGFTDGKEANRKYRDKVAKEMGYTPLNVYPS